MFCYAITQGSFAHYGFFAQWMQCQRRADQISQTRLVGVSTVCFAVSHKMLDTKSQWYETQKIGRVGCLIINMVIKVMLTQYLDGQSFKCF